MTAAPRFQDEYTLLCERCGYVVEGLPTEGACPECGKPIAESLPERRAGWQHFDRGLTKQFYAMYGIIRHPIKTLDHMPIDDRTGELGSMFRSVSRVPLSIGVLLLMFVWLVVFSNNPARDVAGIFIAPIIVWITISPVLGLLTKIEERGLVFLGSKRRIRVDSVIAKSICAHGSAGWLLGSVSFAAGMFAAAIGSVIAFQFDLIDVGGDVAYLPGRELFLWIVSVHLIMIGLCSGLCGLIIGFLFFETFAWLGLRRLKYANRVRPDSPTESESGS